MTFTFYFYFLLVGSGENIGGGGDMYGDVADGDRMKRGRGRGRGGRGVFWHEGSFPWLLNYVRGGRMSKMCKDPPFFFFFFFGKDGAFVLVSPFS